MTTNRAITIVDPIALMEVEKRMCEDEAMDKFQILLGYLTLWGLPSYNKVILVPYFYSGEPEIGATYLNDVGECTFYIQAVYNTTSKKWSTHS
jgi:hypothetical protein